MLEDLTTQILNFGLNTTDTRQAALYFRQAQATFECIASEFLGSALGFYVPQLFASPFSETIDDFPRNRPSLYTSYVYIYIYMYIRECKICMILHVQCEGFLVSLHAEDLPLVDRALCNALVEGPTRELAVARCQIFHHSDFGKPWTNRVFEAVLRVVLGVRCALHRRLYHIQICSLA
jgi:hypothetical protein